MWPKLCLALSFKVSCPLRFAVWLIPISVSFLSRNVHVLLPPAQLATRRRKQTPPESKQAPQPEQQLPSKPPDFGPEPPLREDPVNPLRQSGWDSAQNTQVWASAFYFYFYPLLLLLVVTWTLTSFWTGAHPFSAGIYPQPTSVDMNIDFHIVTSYTSVFFFFTTFVYKHGGSGVITPLQPIR